MSLARHPGLLVTAAAPTEGQADASAVLPAPTPTLDPAIARRVGGGALVAGLVGDLAFADGPAAGLGLAAYLGVALLLLHRTAWHALPFADPGVVLPDNGARALRQPRLVLLLGGLFALLLAIRSAEVLTFLNTVATIGALGLAGALLPGAGRNLFSLRVRDGAAIALRGLGMGLGGAASFLRRDASAATRGANGDRVGTVAMSLARATVLGVLLTATFGALLAIGDPLFEHAAGRLFAWNIATPLTHLATVLLCAWPAAGALTQGARTITLARAPTDDDGSTASIPRGRVRLAIAEVVAPIQRAAARVALNRLDTLIALGSLNALFAAFVLLQLRALFGGQAYVTATTGLTLAQYARSGFFALTFTAGAVIACLLAISTLTPGGLASWRAGRRLSVTLLGFVGVVLVSAVTRMTLYVASFGISVDRIVALAIMAWVTCVGAWFAVTVLRGRPARFVAGALLSGAATLAALNVVNIEAIAVRSAVGRVADGQLLDADYVARELGADAVPTLVDALRRGELGVAKAGWTERYSPPQFTDAELAGRAACNAADQLILRWGPETSARWNEWTLSQWRARRSVAAHTTALRKVCSR